MYLIFHLMIFLYVVGLCFQTNSYDLMFQTVHNLGNQIQMCGIFGLYNLVLRSK